MGPWRPPYLTSVKEWVNFNVKPYQYLWSSGVGVDETNKTLSLSCKTEWYGHKCLSWFCFEVHCVVVKETSALWIMHECIMHFHAMFLPLYFQPLNWGDLGGKGSDQSCQESWWENYPPMNTSRFFCWQAPPSNPEANVGTRRAKYVCISCSDKTSLIVNS